MELIIGLVFGSIATMIFEFMLLQIPYFKVNFWDNPKLIFGYHFHHSLIGLLLVMLGFIYIKTNRKKSLGMIGFGIGVIIIHTISDGHFVFIN